MRYSGILRIGFKLLVNDRGKFFALLIGITFAVFLMMEMTAMFAGILNRAFSPVTNIGAAMWIMDPAVNTATSPIPMPGYVLDAARSMDGVSYAVPLFMGGAMVKLANGTYQGVNVVGLDDSSLFGRPELEQGNIQDIYADNTFFVVHDAEFSKLGNPKIGTTFELNDHRGRIVGIARVAANGLNGVPTLYTTYNRAIEYLPSTRFTMSYVLVQPKNEAAVAGIKRQVAKLGYVAFTKDEFNNRITHYYTYQTGIGTNILLMTIIAFIVGLSISGQTFYTFILENLEKFGALKAIGAKGRELVYMILFMAFFTAMIGYGLGIGLVTLMISIARYRLPNYAAMITFGNLGLAFGMVLLIAGISSYIGIRKVLKIEPFDIFRGSRGQQMKTLISLTHVKTSTTVLLLGCAALLAGCSFAPKYAEPSVQTPVAFKEMSPAQSSQTDGWKTADPMDNALRGQWWEMFHEPELNAFESQVNVSNQTVAVALANFLAARAVVKQSRSQYFPTVSANPSVTRSRQASSQNQSSSSSSASTFTEYALPFDASWEPDFWGRIRNTVKANSLEAQATLADLENVRLSVQAEVAVDYFELRVLDSEKQLLDTTVIAYQESLKLTQAQYGTGLASDQDVAQAETQFNTTLAQATDLGIQRALLEHAIATLLGQSASSFSIDTNSLTTKPVAIPFGVPSQLLERRPDIAAAERRVAEANAQIGVARAAYYPTITLSGAAGYQNTSVKNLFSGPGLVWSVGATLAQTLFDGGLRKAVTEQSQAIYQGTVANYRQTVLTAFQEVEDNLSTLRILSQELQQQNVAVAAAQRYLNLANVRYESGMDIYLNVINAQTALLSNQRTALNLQMEQLTASVQLIKALGGGWNILQGTNTAIPKMPPSANTKRIRA